MSYNRNNRNYMKTELKIRNPSEIGAMTIQVNKNVGMYNDQKDAFKK